MTTTIIGAGTVSPTVSLTSGGSIDNAGTILGGSSGYGVYVDGNGTITNTGTIQGGTRYGVLGLGLPLSDQFRRHHKVRTKASARGIAAWSPIWRPARSTAERTAST